MVAHITKRQRQEKDALERLPRELLNELRADSRPKPELGVSDWRERWKAGTYKRLVSEPWRIAWGLLRHSDDYWYNWAFDVGPRMARDGATIPAVPTDTTEWARTYGLRHALDPALNAFDITENPFSSGRERIYRGPREVNVVLSPNQVIVVVDLSWPLGAQLDAAKRHLKPRSRPSRQRVRNDKYAAYVCALDGKAAGASWAEIGRVLQPKLPAKSRSDTVKNYLRAGAALGYNGYQLIARG